MAGRVAEAEAGAVAEAVVVPFHRDAVGAQRGDAAVERLGLRVRKAAWPRPEVCEPVSTRE